MWAGSAGTKRQVAALIARWPEPTAGDCAPLQGRRSPLRDAAWAPLGGSPLGTPLGAPPPGHAARPAPGSPLGGRRLDAAWDAARLDAARGRRSGRRSGLWGSGPLLRDLIGQHPGWDQDAYDLLTGPWRDDRANPSRRRADGRFVVSPLQTETVCRVSWVALMVDHHCEQPHGRVQRPARMRDPRRDAWHERRPGDGGADGRSVADDRRPPPARGVPRRAYLYRLHLSRGHPDGLAMRQPPFVGDLIPDATTGCCRLHGGAGRNAPPQTPPTEPPREDRKWISKTSVPRGTGTAGVLNLTGHSPRLPDAKHLLREQARIDSPVEANLAGR